MDRRIQRWKIAPELLQRFLLVFVLFLFFSLSIYILFIHSEMDIYSFNSPIFRTDSLTWDIYLEDQLIEKNVSLPYRVKARTGQNIRIETTLSDHVDKSFNCYLIKSNFSSIRILVDGKEISRYPKQRNYPAFLLGCENDFLGFFNQPLNGSRIAVEYHFGSALALNGTKIHPVRIGSFTEIRNLQLNDFFDIYMNFSFYSITITGIVLVFIFVKDNRYKRILSCFALLSLLMMLISIMDNPVISLFLQNQLVVSLILMFSYVLFPFAILLFHLATGHHSNMKNQLISLLSIIPIILFIMFCIALTEEAYTSSLIADLTIFSSVTSAMIISIVAILSRDSEQSHLFQDITIALSTFFIMIRGLLLFIVDLSNNEHLLLSIVTYVPFLISALYGASDYMKMERSYMRSKEIEEYAYQDILSNCLNRRSFEKYIEICSDDAELGILSFDINGLKNINDGFGHTEGDKLLAHFSLMTQMDELKGAKIFRIGGDEFIAFVNYTDETYLSKLVEKAKEFFSTSAPYGATLSIGYSVKHKGENILQAIKKSDRKMYKDKKENREESLYDIARRLNYEDQ